VWFCVHLWLNVFEFHSRARDENGRSLRELDQVQTLQKRELDQLGQLFFNMDEATGRIQEPLQAVRQELPLHAPEELF